MTTRRQLLKSAISAAGIGLGTPLIRRAEAWAVQAANDVVLPLAEDLFALRIPGEATVVAQTSPDGVLLVDGASARGSDALLKAVAALPGAGAGKIHTLFNTHWHPEQTGSNERLGMAGAKIIAQENTRLWLTQNITWPWNGQKFAKLAKVAQPNKSFYTTDKLENGVRYGYVADAPHTDGDLYVYFPNQNVLVVGDSAYGEGWPVIDWWTGGWIGGVVGGLQRLQTVANPQTRIVPARGPLLTTADLRAQTDMYGTIYDRLSRMLNQGRGPTEAVAAKPTKEFDAKMGDPDVFVRRAFESLWAYLSPDA